MGENNINPTQTLRENNGKEMHPVMGSTVAPKR